MTYIRIPYFPTGIKYSTPLLIGAGIYLWTVGHAIWAAILALLIVIILTTGYITEISLVRKEYRDYLSFLGMAFNEEKVKFNRINQIVIRKDNHSQMLNSRSRSSQLDWSTFTATLITDEKRNLNLLTRTDKKELIKGLKKFVVLLKVEVVDQTTSKQFTIDVNKY